jgi:phage terminase large subunit GpA-like protein
LLTWKDLEKLLFEDTYEVEGSDKRMGVWRAAIDTGGGQYEDRSMTDKAYRWIAINGRNRVVGVKGSARQMSTKMSSKLINTLPGKRNVPIPGGGLKLFVIDTSYFKDVLHGRLQIKEGDPGCVYLHRDTELDYALQITAEEKKRMKNGSFQWVHTHGQNHYLDAEVYSSFLVDPACEGGLTLAYARLQRSQEGHPRKPMPLDRKPVRPQSEIHLW